MLGKLKHYAARYKAQRKRDCIKRIMSTYTDNTLLPKKRKRVAPMLVADSNKEGKSQAERLFDQVIKSGLTTQINRGSNRREVHAVQGRNMEIFKGRHPRVVGQIIELSRKCTQVGNVDTNIVNIKNLKTIELHNSFRGDPAQDWHVDADGDARYLTAIIPVDEAFGTEFLDEVPGTTPSEQTKSSDGGWSVSTTRSVIFNGDVVHRGPEQVELPRRRFIAAVYTEKDDVNN